MRFVANLLTLRIKAFVLVLNEVSISEMMTQSLFTIHFVKGCFC